jgi:hypothetical protein
MFLLIKVGKTLIPTLFMRQKQMKKKWKLNSNFVKQI